MVHSFGELLRQTWRHHIAILYKSRAPMPSLEDKSSEAKTSRKDSSPQTPIFDRFIKAFTSEKPLKDYSTLKYDLIGKSFFPAILKFEFYRPRMDPYWKS